MKKINECLGLIENEIKNINILERDPSELYDPIKYILSLGGKRIRPLLSLMACNLFKDDIQSSIKPAIALEIFHNFTLLHDDIMDNAPLRRNKQTVHEKWNSNIAILSGDAMQILAYQLLCNCDPTLLKPLLDIFNSTALEVCEGQQYDMNYSTQQSVSMQEYMKMIELKTSVLIAASIKVGAICGGAPIQDAAKLYEFGRHLGLAFQIQDDFLDAYARQATFGKTIGGDIVENKKTYLLLKAFELAKDKNLEILLLAVDNKITDNTEKIEMVKSVYENLKIKELTLTAINEHAKKAYSYLLGVNVSIERKQLLLDLSTDIMSRKK